MESLKTVKVEGKLNGKRVNFYVDGGSEICVMPKSTIERFGIAIKEIDGGLITAAKARVKFLGVAKVEVDIAGVSVE